MRVAESDSLRASSRAMTSRTTTLRAAIEPHLNLFSADFQETLAELLKLAAVGERAQDFVSSFATGTPDAAPTQARRATRSAKPAATKRTSAASSKGSRTGKTTAASPRGPRASSLRATILDVLRAESKPLPLAEIEQGVKARGHASKSANFAKLLSLTIGKMKTELRRVDRGVYALA